MEVRRSLPLTYVDSNYWIYWFDERLPEHNAASKILDSIVKKDIVASTVTLIEVAHYFRSLPTKEFEMRMGLLLGLETLAVADFGVDVMGLCLSYLSKYSQKGLGGRDCVILATMEIVGSDVLLTHDKSFKAVSEIKVIDEI